MPTIRKLPIGLVNKIAAGEVIERPASVVKEMLENSIDAGATRMELAVEGGGIELIRISDNGCGIEQEQLELAIAPHATSKLQSTDDLFDVRTLGFRGEALASIAEISHLSLKSRTAESDSGYELVVRGGEQEPIHPCSGPVGTTIEVRHLFFNTPVRRKFMKTSQTEMGHVIEAFTRIALAFPHVHMTLLNNDRVVHDLLPTERWSERIRGFFGDEVADSLISIDQRDERVAIRGYVSDPSVSRANNRMQYLFLNGRYIRDRSLQHALGEAYRGLMMVGRMPVCFLHVDVDPKTVDVNVHPTKVEVRFEDSGAIYSRLLSSLRSKFLTTDMVAKVRTPSNDPFSTATEPNPYSPVDFGNRAPRPITTSHDMSSHGTDLLDWAKSKPEAALMGSIVPEFRPYPGASGGVGLIAPPLHSNAHSYGVESLPTPNARIDDPFYSPPSSYGMPHSGAPTSASLPSEQNIDGCAKAVGFQIHQRYLVTEDELGLVIIDQHALHERILFEQIKSKVLSRSVEKQRLLVPETITLTPSETAAALESRETLAELGLDIEPFGGDTLIVTAYPAMFSKFSCEDILRGILEPFMSGGKNVDARDLLDEMMNMMACKAAVKAGDKLSSDEISAMLEQRDLYQDTHHCPHGRPTALFFSREQLDKMFKRT
jgi:DNA mismatch repair protein MutL